MSLYGMMKTGVSGMHAQSNRLGTVADNIANSNTTGYKRATVQFSSLVLPREAGSYSSGGVKTTVLNAISEEGVLQYTQSASDLAISGDGFFVVQDASGSPFLMRAGSFVPDGAGRLVSNGFYLTGYNYENGTPSAVANGFNGLEVISTAGFGISATPSTEGVMYGNLPSGEAVVPAADLPSANAATAAPTKKSSFVVRDSLGNEILMDIYFTKSAANEWEVAIFNQADAAPGTSFPYASGPITPPVTLEFDPTNGKLAAASPTDISFAVPGGETVTIDLSSFTQLATGFSATTSINGSAPAEIEEVIISPDGIVSAQYGNGAVKALYRIPLANVQSPDQLTVLPGNVYAQSADSGEVRIGFPNEGAFGEVVSGALEGSNVDIATELTDMIEAQRNYTANSKVFQTGSDLLDILVNLKR